MTDKTIINMIFRIIGSAGLALILGTQLEMSAGLTALTSVFIVLLFTSASNDF